MPNCLMQQEMLLRLSILQFLYYIFMSFNKEKKHNEMLIDVFKFFIEANVLLIAWKTSLQIWDLVHFPATFET